MKNFSLKTSLILTLLFFCISLFNISHHEMWSDELQVWLLAKHSTLTTLWHNMRFEGHPALWHLMVMSLTRVTENPFAMAILHIIISSLSAFLILRYSPFKFWEKILLLSGYFFIFEYTVLSRSYALEVLLIFSICSLFTLWEKKFIAISILLFFLSQTLVFGLFFSVSILGFIILLSNKEFFKSKKFWIGITIILAGWIICILQIIPDDQYGVAKGWHIFPLSNIGKAVTTIFKSYMPIPDGNYHFWDSHLIMNKAIKSLLTILFLAILTIRYRNTPKLLIFFWLSNIIFWSFFYIKHYGEIRHHGHIFLILIITEWLFLKFKTTESKINFDKLFKPFFYLVLLVQAGIGLYAVYMDYTYPFSMSKATSDYIKINKLNTIPIVSDDEYTGAPLSALLNKPLFYVTRKEFGTFILWNEARFKKINPTEIISIAEGISKEQKTDVLVVFSYKDPKLPTTSLLLKMGTFKESILKTEDYYLYLLKYHSI